MPFRAPSVCGCGRVVAAGQRCACKSVADHERRAANDAKRPSARARGYDTKWDRERASFLQANPRCRLCDDPASVVDHVVPHRGDKKLFWSRSNWQPLCQHCHNSTKQAFEKGSRL